MPPKTKKSKAGNASPSSHSPNASHVRANGQKGGQAKSKKQSESDEFERMLADLNRVTMEAGLRRERQTEREERSRVERDERHKAAADKPREAARDFGDMLRQKQQKLQFQQLLQQLLSAQRPFLDAPNTDFHAATETRSAHFEVAVGEMQGWRVQMEDAHLMDVAFPDPTHSGREGVFAVFDGHSGKSCATACAAAFPRVLRTFAATDGGETAIDFPAAFLAVDAELRRDLPDESGCTAVVVHVSARCVTCASVGDSRAVLCRRRAAVALSFDHKPDNPNEKARIEAAGGSVAEHRVNGQLAMSRAMGDFTYKSQSALSPDAQQVIAVPDVIRTPREAGDAFVVIACDGIFDVLDNDELIARVVSKKEEGKRNVDICEEICNECLAPMAEGGNQPARAEGTDNMTIMIVDLK